MKKQLSKDQLTGKNTKDNKHTDLRLNSDTPKSNKCQCCKIIKENTRDQFTELKLNRERERERKKKLNSNSLNKRKSIQKIFLQQNQKKSTISMKNNELKISNQNKFEKDDNSKLEIQTILQAEGSQKDFKSYDQQESERSLFPITATGASTDSKYQSPNQKPKLVTSFQLCNEVSICQKKQIRENIKNNIEIEPIHYFFSPLSQIKQMEQSDSQSIPIEVKIESSFSLKVAIQLDDCYYQQQWQNPRQFLEILTILQSKISIQ